MHNWAFLIGALLACLFSGTATAIPVPSKEALPSGRLWDPAGVIGKDDRVELTNFRSQNFRNFPSPQEFHALRACSGYVQCPKYYQGSATVVGHSQQIVTARHLFFVNGDFNLVIPDLNSCFFQTYEGEKIPLNLSKEEVTWVDPFRSPNYDYIVAKLQTPVSKCKVPFRVTYREGMYAELNEGDPIILLTHLHDDMDRQKFSGHQPIVQECRVRHVRRAPWPRPPLYYTDCDTNFGASGGLIFTRQFGALTAKALNVAMGTHDVKLERFDFARGHYSIGVGILGDFFNDIKGLND